MAADFGGIIAVLVDAGVEVVVVGGLAAQEHGSPRQIDLPAFFGPTDPRRRRPPWL